MMEKKIVTWACSLLVMGITAYLLIFVLVEVPVFLCPIIGIGMGYMTHEGVSRLLSKNRA